MEKTPSQSPEKSQSAAAVDAARLLQEFVAEGRSEVAFQRVVERLGKLVYSSALRRTGDEGLAEEVAQNVFAALAHKASSLCRHRKLLAWIFKATRYEASKALRSEQSRQKKHAAAATEAQSEQLNLMSPTSEEPWRDAIPLLDASLDELGEMDRQIVLQRFYEGKKFAEIATENGSTEAASKMRVKRALGKLSGLLTARGVSLSTTVIATTLGTELAKAGPVNGLTSLASNALASSATASTGILTINTIEIMSTIKTVTATGAVVIALAATPLILQHSKANKLGNELASLEEQRTAAEGKLTAGLPALPGDRGAPVVRNRTLHDLLERRNAPVDFDQLVDQIVTSMTGQDMIGMIEILLPISNLSTVEYNELLKKLETYEGSAEMKQMVGAALTLFAPTGNSAEAIDRMMKLGAEPYSYAEILGKWASEDPAAALAWFREKSAAGELQGKGILDTNELMLASELLRGTAQNNPSAAVDLFIELASDPNHHYPSSSRDLARGIGLQIASGRDGGDAALRRLLDWNDEEIFRTAVIRSALAPAVEREDIAGGVGFIERYISGPTERRNLITDKISDSGLALDAQIVAAQQYLSADDLMMGVRRIVIAGMRGRENDTTEWLAEQPAGEIRDAALGTITNYHSQDLRFEQALAAAEQIGEPDQRAYAMRSFAGRWLRDDEQAARAALPASVISDLESDQ